MVDAGIATIKIMNKDVKQIEAAAKIFAPLSPSKLG